MVKKKGTDLELVVAAIEKALDPSSLVKHDQFLPVLTSFEGHKRQCDVVIYSGSERRPFVTIVEVQDRNSPVSIGTFDSWVSKRDEVGANQLICVSRKPYPSSILEKAKQQGSRVALIELSAGVPEQLPIDFIKFHFQYVDILAEDINIYCHVSPHWKELVTSQEIDSVTKIQWKNKSFKNNENIDISVYEAVLEIFKKIHPEENTIHTNSCSFSFRQNNELRLFVDVRGHKIPVFLNVELKNYKYGYHRFPMDVAVYRTNGKDDYGWFFEASYNSVRGPISIKVPIVKHEASGGYEMLNIISDVPFDFIQHLSEIEN